MVGQCLKCCCIVLVVTFCLGFDCPSLDLDLKKCLETEPDSDTVNVMWLVSHANKPTIEIKKYVYATYIINCMEGIYMVNCCCSVCLIWLIYEFVLWWIVCLQCNVYVSIFICIRQQLSCFLSALSCVSLVKAVDSLIQLVSLPALTRESVQYRCSLNTVYWCVPSVGDNCCQSQGVVIRMLLWLSAPDLSRRCVQCQMDGRFWQSMRYEDCDVLVFLSWIILTVYAKHSYLKNVLFDRAFNWFCWRSWTCRIAAPYKFCVDWSIDWSPALFLPNFISVVQITVASFNIVQFTYVYIILLRYAALLINI